MAKSLSTSIYPGENLDCYLKEMGERGAREGVSRTLERTVGRYRLMVANGLPAWSVEEWTMAILILKSLDFWNPSSVDVLGLAIQQAMDQRRAAGQSDLGNFAYRAKTLSVFGRVAVAEVVERYFRRHTAIEQSAVEQLLQEMGAPKP